MMELLAPAGEGKSFITAINCGADAIYIGMSNFSARKNAENFSDTELENAIKYCHIRGVRVYLTLNTIPHGHEYPLLREFLQTLANVQRNNIYYWDI